MQHADERTAETLGCAPINDGLRVQLPQTVRIVTAYIKALLKSVPDPDTRREKADM